MIKLEISTLDPEVLVKTATYLMSLAGHQLTMAPIAPQANPFSKTIDDKIVEDYFKQPLTPELDIAIGENCFSPLSHEDSMNESSQKTRPDFVTMPVISLEEANDIVASNADLDASGLPWDARIHATTKTKTANGDWKLRRGVNMNVVDTVLKELRAVMNIPNVILPVDDFIEESYEAPIVPPPPPPLPGISVGTETFITLVNKISKAIAEGKLTQAQMIACVQIAGIPSLPLVAARPDLIPQIASAIDAAIIGG